LCKNESKQQVIKKEQQNQIQTTQSGKTVQSNLSLKAAKASTSFLSPQYHPQRAT